MAIPTLEREHRIRRYDVPPEYRGASEESQQISKRACCRRKYRVSCLWLLQNQRRSRHYRRWCRQDSSVCSIQTLCQSLCPPQVRSPLAAAAGKQIIDEHRAVRNDPSSPIVTRSQINAWDCIRQPFQSSLLLYLHKRPDEDSLSDHATVRLTGWTTVTFSQMQHPQSPTYLTFETPHSLSAAGVGVPRARGLKQRCGRD
jgi:hypothetical protein